MVDILKSNYKSIDNQLKSAEVIRPIKSINTGNSSHDQKGFLSLPYCTLYTVMLEKYVLWNN